MMIYKQTARLSLDGCILFHSNYVPSDAMLTLAEDTAYPQGIQSTSLRKSLPWDQHENSIRKPLYSRGHFECFATCVTGSLLGF